ncbi:spore coat protein [Paenibacillus profundus]|uniref:Spore coat protein n=1 Tax=Paenibacillus profundus TaxID=1173085 RepID=A0ABS8YAV5_9BACL|nr:MULTISPECIES: hypothetical protein [Paenibacillus]MCE5168631.1 spore coat protein [Paenibacillus profundus]MCM3342657.1 spore coat protein [Paenibacillus sp. MER TA 81-3]
MNNRQLGTHEMLEVHELLNFKNVCMTKTKTMMGLVSCQELQGLMQEDVQNSAKAIQDYQALLSRANYI